jgi:O-antigen ligase
MAAADHPHNAFLLIGTELGLLGLAAVFGLLLVQWRTASRLPSRPQTIAARSLLILFVVAGMVSSTFNDHAEGLFFVWASALLWAGMQVKQPR